MDCIVALPTQLFYTTAIPVTLWFLSRGRSGRSGKTLFIDARRLGALIDRRHRDFSEEDIHRIASTYHAWKSSPALVGAQRAVPDAVPDSDDSPAYTDVPGFCYSASLEEIRAQNYILTPGRYVGTTELDMDEEPTEEKINKLVLELEAQFAQSREIEFSIQKNLQRIKYE